MTNGLDGIRAHGINYAQHGQAFFFSSLIPHTVWVKINTVPGTHLPPFSTSISKSVECVKFGGGMEVMLAGKATLAAQSSAFMLSLSIISFLLSFCVLNTGSCENYNDLKNLETEFALTLYQKLAERNNQTNLVISPASISFSLGLLQFGARGKTFGQLEHALGYSFRDENVQNFLHTAYKGGINSNQSTIVHLACTLFVQAGMQLSPQFIQQAAWWGNNTVQPTNFGDPNRTEAQIREWITQNTGGEFLVGSLDQISVVEIPYLEEKVSMFVVLPSNRRISLARIETYLSAQAFSLWSSTLRRTAMDIFLPRFKIQNHLDLKMILPALGITDMFQQTEANFKGISEQGSLYISEVVHKAKIEVTEDGTKASGI
ncbi:hypothetical protein E2320_019656, partial [Naja naja]